MRDKNPKKAFLQRINPLLQEKNLFLNKTIKPMLKKVKKCNKSNSHF